MPFQLENIFYNILFTIKASPVMHIGVHSALPSKKNISGLITSMARYNLDGDICNRGRYYKGILPGAGHIRGPWMVMVLTGRGEWGTNVYIHCARQLRGGGNSSGIKLSVWIVNSTAMSFGARYA